LAAVVALSACGWIDYRTGRVFEDSGRSLLALKRYEKFLQAYPDDPRVCEVHVRAADIYARLSRYFEARRHYEAAARAGSAACAARGRDGVMTCPNYFPLDPGRIWVYGDSASGGHNMRLEWQVRASSGAAVSIAASLYAGDKRVRFDENTYERHDWAFWRHEDKLIVPFLRYPFAEGQIWRVGRGQNAQTFLVESRKARVETAAGVFERCLKVRESRSAFADTWTYDYYAPGVGRVKSTLAGPGYENPNTELIKFDKMN
jgi:tetratricopeptide (TPR) repeat protein